MVPIKPQSNAEKGFYRLKSKIMPERTNTRNLHAYTYTIVDNFPKIEENETEEIVEEIEVEDVVIPTDVTPQANITPPGNEHH